MDRSSLPRPFSSCSSVDHKLLTRVLPKSRRVSLLCVEGCLCVECRKWAAGVSPEFFYVETPFDDYSTVCVRCRQGKKVCCPRFFCVSVLAVAVFFIPALFCREARERPGERAQWKIEWRTDCSLLRKPRKRTRLDLFFFLLGSLFLPHGAVSSVSCGLGRAEG